MSRLKGPFPAIGFVGALVLGVALIVGAGYAVANEVDDGFDDPGMTEADEKGESQWIPHADCTFFGERRGDFLTVGLGADLMRSTTRSQLTSAIVASLPQPPPTRSRARALTAVGQGSAGGDSIDDFIFGALERQGIPTAPPTTDEEFLRRVTLDLTGRVPSLEETMAFLQDASPDKRSQLIARLLNTSEWADRWAMFFGDLFGNTQVTAQVNRYPNGRDAFHLFLRDSMRRNKPYDQMAREMLTSGGVADGRTYLGEYASFDAYRVFFNDYDTNPVRPTAASYIVGGRTTGGPIQDTFDTLAAFAARDFLGIQQMDCILCHDGVGHLDSLSIWGGEAKRLEGWGLASFFSRTRLRRPARAPAREGQAVGPRPPYWIVRENRAGSYRLNTTTGNRPERQPEVNGGVAALRPNYPFGGGGPSGGESNRAALGRLLTADRQFARAAVNYIWNQFFGRGLVDPVNQFDLKRLDPGAPPPAPWTIQPSHPELLEFLAAGFADNGFNLKQLMARIAESRAYQLSSRFEGAWNPTYDRYFARHQVRRLRAEEVHDAVVTTSGVIPSYRVSNTPELRFLSFAMQFPDVRDTPRAGRARDNANSPGASAAAFLDAFLRGDREETPRSPEASIIQALQAMNNPVVVERVVQSGRVGFLAAALNQPDDALVTALYLQVLTRFPTPEEMALAAAHLSSGERREKAEDLMWVLYNKVDFLFNY